MAVSRNDRYEERGLAASVMQPRLDLAVNVDKQSTTLDIAAILGEVRDEMFLGGAALFLDEQLEAKFDETEGRRKMLSRIMRTETIEGWNQFCRNLNAKLLGVFGVLSDIQDKEDDGPGWRVRPPSKAAFLNGSQLIAKQIVLQEVQAYVQGLYLRAVKSGIDPKTNLPILETVNENALDLLRDEKTVGVATMDLAGMGAFNLAFGDLRTDYIVETKLKMLASALQDFNPNIVAGRRQMMQGDEMVINFPDVSTADDVMSIYEEVILPAFDIPVTFYIDDEEWRTLEQRRDIYTISEDKKEKEAAKVLTDVLENKEAQRVDGHRLEDRGKNLYKIELTFGGRIGVKIVDGVEPLNVDNIAALRTDVQQRLEAGTARSLQYANGNRNPIAIEDLEETVYVAYGKGKDGDIYASVIK